MPSIKPERIAHDDPINVNLLAMGFKRSRETKAKKLPVNRWWKSNGNRGVTIKPNWRGEYVVSLFETSHPTRQVIVRRVSEVTFDDPYSLAVYLSLEGDGDVIAAALRLCTKAQRGELP